MPRLIRRDRGEAIELPDGVTQIGRLSANDIQVFEREVSRSHCHIEGPEGGWVILDHGTDLGTFVNGRRIRMIGLHPGDEIKVGSVVFEFDTSPPDATPPTRLVPREPAPAEEAEAPEAPAPEPAAQPQESAGVEPPPGLHLRPLSEAAPEELVPAEHFRKSRRRLRPKAIAAAAAGAAALGLVAGLSICSLTRPTPRRVVRHAADLLSRRDADALWALLAAERKQQVAFEEFRLALLTLPDDLVEAARHLEALEGRPAPVGTVVPFALQVGSRRIADEIVLCREQGQWKILDAPVHRLQELK